MTQPCVPSRPRAGILGRACRRGALAVLGADAGCAAPPDHFHTLRPPLAAAPTSVRATPQQLAIGPVTVPESLGRAEWVIRGGDTAATVYSHQLWTQSLSADVAQSLVDYLNGESLPDALWATAGPTGAGSGTDLDTPPALRVRVQVLRMDSLLAPAPAISDQVRWTIECLPADPALAHADVARYIAVRSAVRDFSRAAAGPTSADDAQQRFDRIAGAHSETVHLVAQDIAGALRESAAERARDCRLSAR